MIVRGVLLGILLLPVLRTGHTQPSNMEVFQTLAVRGLSSVPDTLAGFRLAPAPDLPYLAAPLVAAWQADGRTVFLADSSGRPPPDLPLLRYAVEDARLAYDRLRRRRVRRTVSLALQYTLTAADGRVLDAGRRAETAVDTLAADRLDAVEHEAFPETQAAHPEAGWVRRYLEPAAAVAATAVGVYLFFSLRSRRADDQ